MKQELIDKLVKPEGQLKGTFKAYTEILRLMDKLTNEQLSSLSFECWYEAKQRTLEEN